MIVASLCHEDTCEYEDGVFSCVSEFVPYWLNGWRAVKEEDNAAARLIVDMNDCDRLATSAISFPCVPEYGQALMLEWNVAARGAADFSKDETVV